MLSCVVVYSYRMRDKTKISSCTLTYQRMFNEDVLDKRVHDHGTTLYLPNHSSGRLQGYAIDRICVAGKSKL